MSATSAQVHPGAFVRSAVLPAGMSVKEAAKRLGISRPTLSNFLNGKAALSSEMAVRLEKAFGADRKLLLDLQSAWDQHERRGSEKNVAVRAFVPNFLTIKASHIEQWVASQIDARTLFPVLLRKLVHSTCTDLYQADFPGYDNAQRRGSDGFVDAGAATPWVPAGKSYWEFGTDKKPASKADADYAARLTSLAPTERANATFVFVTPRNWPGKGEWEKRKREAGDWKFVRAFDGSDIEQWLEQSVPAQIWLAEQIGLPADGYETLEQAWRRWSRASEPCLSPELFAPSVAAYGATFKSWLDKPSEQPFVIAADSKDEALAFLACLFDSNGLRPLKDSASVFTSASTLRLLVASSIPFIPIVVADDTERELADSHRRLHCIVFRPRNTVDSKADVVLDRLSHDTFQTALVSMGINEGEVERLSIESGRSPTILRRRLSKNAAIRTPAWARDDDAAKLLIPMALIGAWHGELEADREIVLYVADRKFEAVEDEVARLLGYDESPVWSAGSYRGVLSKIDALFAIARMVTSEDLDRFFVAAEYVLSEKDPALELPENERWAAALYGKKRDHSVALREGVCETLVILSVHGDGLFQARLGVDVETRVATLIRKLLTPLTLETLLSHDRDLPRYAEAAPEAFLRIIEEDLRRPDPTVFGLLKPVDRSSFGGSPWRTGILWALECLAWKPQNLPRVARILGVLSGPKIDDNWVNKPDETLQAIFRSWVPQTAASIDQRIKALEILVREFPDVAWEIALEQVKPGPRYGHYSYRPRWRGDASGAGQVVTDREAYQFSKKALDLLFAWPCQNEKTLGDLVESLQGMREEDQTTVWDLVDTWSGDANDDAKANLRERIRRFAFTRQGRNRRLGDATRDRARASYEGLRPVDAVVRHAWLFADQWLRESADEFEDEAFDYRKRDERIDRSRRDAMAEIWDGRGFDGVRELLLESRAAGTIGRYAATCITDAGLQVEFISNCLSLAGDLRTKAEWCVQGFLVGIESGRNTLLRAASEAFPAVEQARLFSCAPFDETTWRLLDEYTEDIRTVYWKTVAPSLRQHTPTELIEIIDRLLEVKRPRAAFQAVHMDLTEIETSRLKRLVRDVATVDAEPGEDFRLDRHYISEALNSLDGRPGVSRDEMAQFEFLFIEVLRDSEHGVPNLESQIAESPATFAQAIALAYKRSDKGQDPPAWRVENPDQKVAVARAAHRLLDQIKTIPGTDQHGHVAGAALAAWLTDVRRLCKEHARADIGDQCLGQLLARAPAGQNGVWPCEAVCQAMEEFASPQMATGFHIGVHNSRGVQWRGEGGEQERELAAKYRAWAERLHFEYPYMGSVLEGIASSYDREAGRQDSEARVSNRLRH